MQAEATVFVVDGDASTRHSLTRAFRSVHLRVETHRTARGFLESHELGEPGCVVLEFRLPLPGMSGLDLQQELAGRGDAIPLIFLTEHGDVPTTVRAIKRGAVDVLEKPFRAHELLDAVKLALELDEQRRGEWAERADVERRLASLSPREREVMDLLLVGRANKEMAARMGITMKTVEYHRANLIRKLGIDSMIELVRFR